MKSIDLLNKYPLAAEKIKQWFFDRMLESMKDNTVPDEFKASMMAEAVTNERLAVLIDVQPRTLFDVFDKHDLSINITRTPNRVEEWDWEIMQAYAENSVCKSRKEAEICAIKAAFELLNAKLETKTEEK